MLILPQACNKPALESLWFPALRDNPDRLSRVVELVRLLFRPRPAAKPSSGGHRHRPSPTTPARCRSARSRWRCCGGSRACRGGQGRAPEAGPAATPQTAAGASGVLPVSPVQVAMLWRVLSVSGWSGPSTRSWSGSNASNSRRASGALPVCPVQMAMLWRVPCASGWSGPRSFCARRSQLCQRFKFSDGMADCRACRL
jgi:hypothetical protein